MWTDVPRFYLLTKLLLSHCSGKPFAYWFSYKVNLCGQSSLNYQSADINGNNCVRHYTIFLGWRCSFPPSSENFILIHLVLREAGYRLFTDEKTHDWHRDTGVVRRQVTTHWNPICSLLHKANSMKSAKWRLHKLKRGLNNYPQYGQDLFPQLWHSSPPPPVSEASGDTIPSGPPRHVSLSVTRPNPGQSLTASSASYAGRPAKRAPGSWLPTPGSDLSC